LEQAGTFLSIAVPVVVDDDDVPDGDEPRIETCGGSRMLV